MYSLEQRQYPIGKFHFPENSNAQPDPALLADWIAQLEAFPQALRLMVGPMSPEQLDTPYRPGGWAVKQVIHHLADSHLNAYIRIKLILTEEQPLVKPYDEARWAELADAQSTEIAASIAILEGIHQRMVAALRALSPADFERTFRHPEYSEARSLAYLTALYAWHGRHHLAQIALILEP